MTTTQFQTTHAARLTEMVERHRRIREGLKRRRQRAAGKAKAKRAEETAQRRLARLKRVCVVYPDGTLGEPFPSVFHVAAEFGVRALSVRESIRTGFTMRIGLRFCYAGQEPMPPKNRKAKKLVRVADGKVIDSMTIVVGPCGSNREYRMQMNRLTRAIRRGKAYRGRIYVYQEAA